MGIDFGTVSRFYDFLIPFQQRVLSNAIIADTDLEAAAAIMSLSADASKEPGKALIKLQDTLIGIYCRAIFQNLKHVRQNADGQIALKERQITDLTKRVDDLDKCCAAGKQKNTDIDKECKLAKEEVEQVKQLYQQALKQSSMYESLLFISNKRNEEQRSQDNFNKGLAAFSASGLAGGLAGVLFTGAIGGTFKFIEWMNDGTKWSNRIERWNQVESLVKKGYTLDAARIYAQI